jgi:tetratricopeptide (TPR) repeat protein
MAEQKPIVIQFLENEWQFVFPRSMDHKRTSDKYYKGVDFVDYDDVAAEKIFKELIRKHPYHIDAYNHLSLAFKNQRKLFESFITAEKAYMIGKTALPKEFKPGKSKLRWGIMQNRPFLRACHILGLEYQGRAQYQEAIDLYTEAQLCDENNHQGLRSLILQCRFAMRDFDGAAKLLKKYKDDWSIDFIYGKLLLAIIKDEQKRIKPLLREALEYNTHVRSEILKNKIAPVDLSDIEYIAMHSEEEAYEYWASNRDILSEPCIKSFFAQKETLEELIVCQNTIKQKSQSLLY